MNKDLYIEFLEKRIADLVGENKALKDAYVKLTEIRSAKDDVAQKLADEITRLEQKHRKIIVPEHPPWAPPLDVTCGPGVDYTMENLKKSVCPMANGLQAAEVSPGLTVLRTPVQPA